MHSFVHLFTYLVIESSINFLVERGAASEEDNSREHDAEVEVVHGGVVEDVGGEAEARAQPEQQGEAWNRIN